jgi:superfamily II DNA or RNA helicase
LREVETAAGPRWVQEAYPTVRFWKQWRLNKGSLSQAGIYLTKVENEFKVRRILCRINGTSSPVKVKPYLLRDNSKLLHYQEPAVSLLCSSLVSNSFCVDASDAGTGKTYTALAACRELRLRPGIICTKTGIIQWKRVCAYFGISPLFVINWESVITRTLKDKNGREYLKSGFRYCEAVKTAYGNLYYKWMLPEHKDLCLIFDECHRANGLNTNAQKVFLAAKGFPVIALSATVAEKPEGLRGIGYLCDFFKLDGFSEWLKEHGCYKNNYDKWESVSPRQDMEKIGGMIFPAFGARIRKNDVPGFPDIQNLAETYPIEAVQAHNTAYSDLITGLTGFEARRKFLISERDQAQDQEKINELNTLIREAQANKLVLNLRYRQQTELLKVPLIVDLAREAVESGQSAVIFVNFTETLQSLKKRLKTDCIIWGAQSAGKSGMEERTGNIDDFQADRERILIANINAGGVSISLHDLNGQFPRVALISPTYSATVLVQAMGRIHRAGAKSKAINRIIYAAGTIEEDVCRAVSVKLDCISALNDQDLAERDIFKLTQG